MNQELFTLMLDCLEPETLAYLARDLADQLEDWDHFPQEAPAEPLKKELERMLKLITTVGTELTAETEPGFAQMIEQARADRPEADWASQRDRQERQNWLQDYQ